MGDHRRGAILDDVHHQPVRACQGEGTVGDLLGEVQHDPHLGALVLGNPDVGEDAVVHPVHAGQTPGHLCVVELDHHPVRPVGLGVRWQGKGLESDVFVEVHHDPGIVLVGPLTDRLHIAKTRFRIPGDGLLLDVQRIHLLTGELGHVTLRKILYDLLVQGVRLLGGTQPFLIDAG